MTWKMFDSKVLLDLTRVKTIQYDSMSRVLGCFYTLEIGLDFSIHHFSSHWITTIICKTRPNYCIAPETFQLFGQFPVGHENCLECYGKSL